MQQKLINIFNGLTKQETSPSKSLTQLVKRKGINLEQDYTAQSSKKINGSSVGKIVQRKEDNSQQKYIMKNAILPNNNNFDCMSLIKEICLSSLYQRFMYNRAPFIVPVKMKNTVFHEIGMTSEFLPNEFQTLAQYTHSSIDDMLGKNAKFYLSQVSGAEKLFATMMMLGEYDIHAGNLGVMNENGNQVYAKIDHGWSASQFFTTPSIALENLANAFNRYQYNGVITLNIENFINAINQICYINNEEIKSLLDQRFYMLVQMGIKNEDIKKLNMCEWIDDRQHLYNEDNMPKFQRYNTLDDFQKHLECALQKQLEVMRGVAERLSIISKIDVPESLHISQEQWKSGQWLSEISGMHPLGWAIYNFATIEHKDPKVWAAELMINEVKTKFGVDMDMLVMSHKPNHQEVANIIKNNANASIIIVISEDGNKDAYAIRDNQLIQLNSSDWVDAIIQKNHINIDPLNTPIFIFTIHLTNEDKSTIMLKTGDTKILMQGDPNGLILLQVKELTKNDSKSFDAILECYKQAKNNEALLNVMELVDTTQNKAIAQ